MKVSRQAQAMRHTTDLLEAEDPREKALGLLSEALSLIFDAQTTLHEVRIEGFQSTEYELMDLIDRVRMLP